MLGIAQGFAQATSGATERITNDFRDMASLIFIQSILENRTVVSQFEDRIELCPLGGELSYKEALKRLNDMIMEKSSVIDEIETRNALKVINGGLD